MQNAACENDYLIIDVLKTEITEIKGNVFQLMIM